MRRRERFESNLGTTRNAAVNKIVCVRNSLKIEELGDCENLLSTA
jgi:hypothetical protein